jgi:membrane-associated phospholipid phosphatase
VPAVDGAPTRPGPQPSVPLRLRRFLATLDRARRELAALDVAVYEAVADIPSPTLDPALARISNAANYSRLWLAVAGVLTPFGTEPRRAALTGLAAVGATSAVVNLAVKPLLARSRPTRAEASGTQRVRMPTSRSFPSGHAASAFTFASAVGGELPALAMPLRLMATTVAYSRVHTGVHYPGDVIIGALIGAGTGTATRLLAQRVAARSRFISDG